MLEVTQVARLNMCRACLTLRGPFYDDFNHRERVQLCGCDPDQPPWNAYDYNCFAELCHCCAAEIVKSGTKWSPFFCDDCKTRVRAYNESIGFCAIPLGRHSIMNGVALRVAPATERRQVDTFVKGLFGLFERVGCLSSHRQARIRRILTSLPKRTGPVPLPTYLACAKEVSSDGDAVFGALVSAMAHQTN